MCDCLELPSALINIFCAKLENIVRLLAGLVRRARYARATSLRLSTSRQACRNAGFAATQLSSFVVRLPGVEPGTSPLSGVRSNQAELQSQMSCPSNACVYRQRMPRMESCFTVASEVHNRCLHPLSPSDAIGRFSDSRE